MQIIVSIVSVLLMVLLIRHAIKERMAETRTAAHQTARTSSAIWRTINGASESLRTWDSKESDAAIASMQTNAASAMTAISRAERNARRTEETDVKTIPDIATIILRCENDQLMHGTWTAVFMAAIAFRMICDGRC